MKPEELSASLAGFTGTEGYLRVHPGLVLTDGAAFLAKNAGCYWLFDIIWSYLPQCRKDKMLREMQFWKLAKVAGTNKAVVTCERDTDNVAFKQEIEYTDFPLDSIKLYVQWSGEFFVAMLPSEY